MSRSCIPTWCGGENEGTLFWDDLLQYQKQRQEKMVAEGEASQPGLDMGCENKGNGNEPGNAEGAAAIAAAAAVAGAAVNGDTNGSAEKLH